MNVNEIKKKMMGLWESVFHDSKEYISLIFDNYFNPEYVEFVESDGRIVSALLGVPYEFGNGKNRLKGLYLCGLATSENFRQKGLMTGLIDNINERFSEEFDFTFLIPANDLMADYYHRQGYFNSFYRVEERYTSVHDFKNDFLVGLTDSDERIINLKKNLFEELRVVEFGKSQQFTAQDIIAFIKERESKPGSIVNLLHSSEDIEIILKENQISGGTIFIAYDKDSKITGIAFTVKEDIKRIGIPAIFVTDNCSYYVLLNHIKLFFDDYSISLYKQSATHETSLIEKIFGAENPDGSDLETLFGMVERPFNPSQNMQPYGMVRLLRFDRILNFIAETNKEATFKIIIKDKNYISEGDSGSMFVIDRGEMRRENIDEAKINKSVIKLSSKELSELLLRKRDNSSLIMEAFGIPRLVLKMALMLD